MTFRVLRCGRPSGLVDHPGQPAEVLEASP
jgi:hypothetical protein